MNIKAILRCHLIHVRIAYSKYLQITSVNKDIEKRDPYILLNGMLSGTATEEPQKTKYRMRIWPRNFIPGYITEKKK